MINLYQLPTQKSDKKFNNILNNTTNSLKYEFSMSLPEPFKEPEWLSNSKYKQFYEKNSGMTIYGIMKEIPGMSMNTSLSNAPHNIVVDKLKSFIDNEWIKMFAANNPEYKPLIATDAWTQQLPQIGDYLKFDFSTRAYAINGFAESSSYFDIIKFLTIVSAPIKFDLANGIDIIGNALVTGYTAGKEMGEAVDNILQLFNTSDTETISLYNILKYYVQGGNKRTDDNTNNYDIAKKLHTVLDKLEDFGPSQNLYDKVGCPTINLNQLGLIKIDSNEENSLPFLLTSWSMKPSLETTRIKNTKTEKTIEVPLYVDFNIAIESSIMPTDTELPYMH